jgi:tetratricopeptide (TPR) repeat protein
VRLSLASVSIDLGKLDEAKEEIDDIRDKATGEKRLILQNIEAQYELARGNIERANRLVSDALKQRRTVPSLGLMAKIEAQQYRKALVEGQLVLADSHREQALKLLQEGLVIEPTNPQLLKQMETMENIPTP